MIDDLMEYKVSGSLFKVIVDFKNHVDSQEGNGLAFLDEKIMPIINTLVEFVKVEFTKECLTLGVSTAMTVSSAEQIIKKGIKDGMKSGKFYKDIYQDVKKNVAVFALLHGKSEVITNLLVEQ